MDNEPEEGPDERIEEKPSATGRNRVVYEEEEEIPSPADEFRGKIQMPHIFVSHPQQLIISKCSPAS